MTKYLIFALSLLIVCVTSLYLVLNLHKEGSSKSVAQPQAITPTEREYYPLVVGNRWEYDGETETAQEDGTIKKGSGKKISEVVNVQTTESGKIVTLKNTYFDSRGELKDTLTQTLLVNNGVVLDYTDKKFLGRNYLFEFPLSKGQRWGEDEEALKKNKDDLNIWKVEDKFSFEVLGKQYPDCFRLSFKVEGGIAPYKVFCYGLGVVEEGYKRNGPAMDWTNRLVSFSLH